MDANSTVKIDIAKDFSPVPAGRHLSDGDYSGEAFREKFLAPALRKFQIVEVSLDNTEGFGSSFLEEAFGGLVRSGFSSEFLSNHLRLISSSVAGNRYKNKILKYIHDAAVMGR